MPPPCMRFHAYSHFDPRTSIKQPYRIKAKGCRMTLPNQEKANPDVLEKILIGKCIN